MKQQFESWYSSMSFQTESEIVQKRWVGVSSVANKTPKDKLAMLARLAFRLKLNFGTTELNTLREELSGGGPRPLDEELCLLAASALAVGMDNKSDPMVALTVACVSCAGLRQLEQKIDMVGMYQNALQKMADTERRRPALEQGRLQTPKTEAFEAKLSKAMKEEDWNTALNDLCDLTTSALQKMASRQRSFETAAQLYLTVQDEELDILWWLQGGHSLHAGEDFLKVPVEHRPLLMSFELATITKVLPGPPSVEALLTRAGVLDAPKQSIAAAVQVMPAAWLQIVEEWVDVGSVSPHITPILFALIRRHEADGSDEWIGPWATATGIARDAVIEPVKFALAAYREFLLNKLGS